MNSTRLIGKLFVPRQKAIDSYAVKPAEIQHKVFRHLITKAADTEWGVHHNYAQIQNYEEYRQQVPVQTYDDIKPYVERMRHGESDVLWPGKIGWYAKSSGTTNDKSKFIPVSKEGLHDVHYAGGADCVASYLRNYPESRLF